VKDRKLKSLGHTIRKSVSLEKDIIEGMMPGSRGAKMIWMNNVRSWTGLTTEGAIRAAGGREVWRKIVYDATNPRNKD